MPRFLVCGPECGASPGRIVFKIRPKQKLGTHLLNEWNAAVGALWWRYVRPASALSCARCRARRATLKLGPRTHTTSTHTHSQHKHIKWYYKKNLEFTAHLRIYTPAFDIARAVWWNSSLFFSTMVQRSFWWPPRALLRIPRGPATLFASAADAAHSVYIPDYHNSRSFSALPWCDANRSAVCIIDDAEINSGKLALARQSLLAALADRHPCQGSVELKY